MLTLTNVSSGYGKLQVLNDMSLEVDAGRLTVIVGPNGSGKSTLLKTISGLTKVYSGKVTMDGKDLTGLPPHVIARSGVAYLPQTEAVFPFLTVEENFKMASLTVKKEDYGPRFKEITEMFPQLVKYMKGKVNNLSGGERQMVAMGMALVRNPKVVMFDEPTANLSPKLANEVLKTIASLTKAKDLCVLLVEQNARRALEIGDDAYLMVSGRKTFEGKAADLLAHQELAKLYLGVKLT